MNKEEFLVNKLEKAGVTLKGIASLVTQSFEIEAMTGSDSRQLRDRLNQVNGGLASNKQVNDGNGWNNDIHHDVSLVGYTPDNGGLYGTETSSSPIDTLGYGNLKEELEGMLDIYKDASGKVCHTVRGSVHVHNTVAYYDDTNSVELDVNKFYENMARFTIKFMPVMKWLTMTDKLGARGIRGSAYGDRFHNDGLFNWYDNYNNELSDDDDMELLMGLGRSSCFRVYNRRSVHFENRLCDSTFSATHLAMWLSINKAMTLFAIDFTRNGYTFPLSQNDVNHSQSLLRQHARGYESVNRGDIQDSYKEFVSYLAKYLKIAGSLEAIDVMDKLIKCPISQWLNENNVGADYWDMMLIEKSFNTRNRASDADLRGSFMELVKTMAVPFADNLNDFHDNMAIALGVETKKVKSLYQMFKRENTDIEFLGGRLIYLGD